MDMYLPLYPLLLQETKSGDEIERVTDWHRVTVWGKLADLCLEHLYVGCDIGVEGQLQVDNWVNKSGQKRSKKLKS